MQVALASSSEPVAAQGRDNDFCYRRLIRYKLSSIVIGVIMLIEFIKDEGAQDVVEFSLLLVLIAATAMVLLTYMGQSISAIFSKLNTKIDSANQAIS